MDITFENKLANFSIIFMGFALVFVVLNQFQSFLRPFVISIILTFLLVPFTRLSKKKKKLIYLNSFLVIIVIIIFISLFITIITNDTEELNSNNKKNNLVENLNYRFENIDLDFFGFNINYEKIFNSEKLGSFITELIGKLANSLTIFFKEFFLVIIFLIFLLPSYDTTLKKISRELSPKSKIKFKLTLNEIEKSIRDYLIIKSLISLGTALISLIFMILFGVDNSFLFSFLIFTLNFIPNLGSIFAVIIILISYFITYGMIWQLLVLGIFLVLTQIIFGNFLEPKIAGKELELSPILILLSLFFWGSVWGIGGMFFAVPLTSILKIILSNIDSTKKIVPFMN